MFKSATWRSQKKIKAVFKMQFQATQVPKLKAKNLMISLVPADVGKPTVRLGKSPILEGTCSWENPVYETVKLVKETKSGQYKGKLYYFVVSSGSSKAGFLGETAVDFVDFLEAFSPVMLSLPLEPTNSGAILHVTIQKLEGTLDERYLEEDESPTNDYYNESLDVQLKESDELEKKNLEDTRGEEPNSRLHEQSFGLGCNPSQDNINKASQECTKTAEKCSLNADVLGDMYGRYPDGSFKETSDISVIETGNSPRETYAMKKMHLPSNDVTWMNNQIKTLERQAEVSELELQSLRRQIAKESRKVQELTGKIVSLNQERDTLKTECEQLKTSPKSIQEPEVSNNRLITENLSNMSEEINQELCRQKQLNKKLKFQLQKTEDLNSELILAVRDLKEGSDRKNKELFHLSVKLKANQNDPKAQADTYMYKVGQKKETKEVEETVREHSKADELELLKQKLASLSDELELSRKEKEELKVQIQQLTQDYEVAKKETGDIYSDLQQKQIAIMEMQNENTDSLATVKQLKLQEERFKQEIKNQALLYSESLAAIDELETEVMNLEKKLKREAKDFEDKLIEVSQAKVEQEQRAIRAEEALRNANWSKTKITERLREDLRKKSEEMTSKINDNEKLAMQAVAEANEIRQQNEILQKLLQKANVELHPNKDISGKKVQDLAKGISSEKRSISSVSPRIDIKNIKIACSKGNEESEANKSEVRKLKPERHACSQKAYEKGKCDGELFYEKNSSIHEDEKSLDERDQKGKQCVESEMQKKWSEEKEELERKLCSLRKESEKLIEENTSLRTLIGEKKKRDEILHHEMQHLSTQCNKPNRGSQEMNLENRNLKKQVLQMKGDLQQKVQQKDVVINTAEENQIQNAYQDTLPQGVTKETNDHDLQKNGSASDKIVYDGAPEVKGEGENTHSSELDNLDGATAEIEFCKAQSKRNDSRSRKELKMGSPQACNVSDIAKLLNEIASLKEGNMHMAVELKEMQERYSEISLKFAEVEGERQRLVMTLRNLRNGKKT